jgi:hypothetical protein
MSNGFLSGSMSARGWVYEWVHGGVWLGFGDEGWGVGFFCFRALAEA